MDIISRKEYDEKQTATLLSIANLTTAAASNTQAIAALVESLERIRVTVQQLVVESAKAKVYIRILWPAVATLVGIIGFLLGGRVI